MTRLLLLTILCLCVCSRMMGEPYEGYKFSLNGKAEEIWVLTTEGPEPVKGDVAKIGGYYLCLEEPGVYDFETREDGALVRVMPDGKKVVVACTVGMAYESNGVKHLATNPLVSMNDAELKALRGVSLERWTNGMDVLLKKLDLAKVCLYVHAAALDRESVKLRAFPGATSHLILDSGGSMQCSDFSSLGALKQLCFLRLDDISPPVFDYRDIAGLPLEFLTLPWVREVKNFESITTLKKLKTLHTGMLGYVGDASFLGELPELRQFYGNNISGFGDGPPEALDLRGLATHPKLVRFEVSNSSVKHLPQATLPALKKASIMWTQTPEEEVEIFLKANPQAVIAANANVELAATLKKATRLRVRSGGVRLGVGEKVKTFCDTLDAEVIRDFSSHLKVEESKGFGRCACLGDLTFEFYEGEKSLAIIGYHHGRAIRWWDGNWPDDGKLVPGSATYLADWLAKQGCLGPNRELERELLEKQRQKRYEALVPKAIRDVEMDRSINYENMGAALQVASIQHLPDASERALLMLRLYGSDDGYRGESLIKALWASIPEQTMRELIPRIDPETDEGRGAAHWLFGIGHALRWKEQWPTIEPFARRELKSAGQEDRRRTLAFLRDTGGAALPLLREVVTNPQPRQKASEDDAVPSYNIDEFDRVRVKFPSEVSDQVIAALCLASLKDEVTEVEVARIRLGLPLEMAKAWEEYLEAYRKIHSRR